jgi:hypothetical protein
MSKCYANVLRQAQSQYLSRLERLPAAIFKCADASVYTFMLSKAVAMCPEMVSGGSLSTSTVKAA